MLIKCLLQCLIFIVLLFGIDADTLDSEEEGIHDTITELLKNTVSEWVGLRLKCDVKERCAYFIDPDMSQSYSDLFIDECLLSNINTTEIIPDGNERGEKMANGDVIVFKTLRIPCFEVNCSVHFNDRDGNMAAEYVLKGRNEKSNDFGTYFRFRKESKSTQVFMEQPIEDLGLRFRAR